MFAFRQPASAALPGNFPGETFFLSRGLCAGIGLDQAYTSIIAGENQVVEGEWEDPR